MPFRRPSTSPRPGTPTPLFFIAVLINVFLGPVGRSAPGLITGGKGEFVSSTVGSRWRILLSLPQSAIARTLREVKPTGALVSLEGVGR